MSSNLSPRPAASSEDALSALLKEQARASLRLALDMLDVQPVRALGLLQYFARRYSDMLGEVMDEGEKGGEEDYEDGGLIARPRLRRRAGLTMGGVADITGQAIEAQRIAALAQAALHGNERVRAWANHELESLVPPVVTAADAGTFEEAAPVFREEPLDLGVPNPAPLNDFNQAFHGRRP